MSFAMAISNPCYLLAFGFGNLALLGWLAAAAAPLLIHLWSRHRFREARWAAMQFLLAAMRKNARRLQVQQWLLLAVRTLIIALVVLALAEPYGEQLRAGGGSGPAHKLLVLDGSYSMAYGNGDATHFRRAKELAAALVRDSRPADVFTVILMADPARVVCGRQFSDPARIAAEIESLAQYRTSADLTGAIALAQEAITNTNQRTASRRQEVYFFTDLQRTTWAPPDDTDQEAVAPLQSAMTALAQHATLAVIDVGEPRATNLAVTSLMTPEPFITTNRQTVFEATLRQFGKEPRQGCVVELLVDDTPVAEQTVDVPADTDTTVRFTYRFTSPGLYTIAVRAAADSLAIDDTRWIVAPARDEVRVLCIEGREGAARYVAQALNPNRAGNSPIRPLVVTEGDVAELELSNFDAVFLCNVGEITPGEVQRLARYADAGGGLVFFLGDRVSADRYNAHAVAPGSQVERENEALLPARIGEVMESTQFGVDPLDYRHSIVAPFRGRERAGLLNTPVSRYLQLDVSESLPGVEVAAAMPNGDPLIITAPLGRGRIILVATDASLGSVNRTTGEPWTHWPTWPSFLPMIREMLAYATAGRQQAWQQRVGATLGGNLSHGGQTSQSPPASLKITRPDGKRAAVSLEDVSDGWTWSYRDTDLSGIYVLENDAQNASQRFAINVDPLESDLTRADPQGVPAKLLPSSTHGQSTEDGAEPQLSRAGWEQSLLWAAFALMLVEACLAWQFGRGIV
jgi:hypothetical protein